ncbi:hypothetical protein ACKVMT_02280 [Halobacteriales archaeon Cl-PHB]
MAAVPGDVDTNQQPPMAVPLRHFLVGLAFLLAGVTVGLADAVGAVPGLASLVHVHLLLAGWVALTIMGAMTQFVPVWSGVGLYSRRLATLELWLVVAGLLGFTGALWTGWLGLAPVGGAVLLLGFWVFVYNVGRTLSRGGVRDVTERHFALALGFFLVATAFGFTLALDFAVPVLADLGVARANVVGAHVTLAVFGGVLTTVVGALYQLATMFTQTDLRRADLGLQRAESVAFPLGVTTLALGRLAGSPSVATVGGLLVAGSLVAVAVVVARRLWFARVDWTPMHSRYAVVAVATAAWGLLAMWAWLGDPLARATLLGAPGTGHLLALGVVGFVVLGTLYHVIPFIVWVHTYSDRLGFEPVPLIDDLYDDRLAAVDFACLLGGSTGLVVADAAGLTGVVPAGAGLLVSLGAGVAVWNLVGVVRHHSPQSLLETVFGALARRDGSDPERDADRV